MLSPLLIMPGFSAASTLAANLDIPRLFDQAHWIVKAVMLLLALMFIIGLYIIIYKWLYVRRATSESTRFTDSFWRSRDIEQIYKQAQALRNSPISQMFVAGYTELAKLASDENPRAPPRPPPPARAGAPRPPAGPPTAGAVSPPGSGLAPAPPAGMPNTSSPR